MVCLKAYPDTRWKSLAPAALLTVGGGNYQGFVVRFGGMVVDGGCGLGSDVADFGVEIQRANGMGAVRAVKLHAALDALDSVCLH